MQKRSVQCGTIPHTHGYLAWEGPPRYRQLRTGSCSELCLLLLSVIPAVSSVPSGLRWEATRCQCGGPYHHRQHLAKRQMATRPEAEMVKPRHWPTLPVMWAV